MKFKKLTAKEIIAIVANTPNLSEHDFATGNYYDHDLVNEWDTEPIAEHLAKVREISHHSIGYHQSTMLRKAYLEEQLPGMGLRYVSDLLEHGWKLAGSPKILGERTIVNEYGGEGEGETWYTVTHFIDHGVYIRVDGYYQSHHGVEVSDYGYEVFPKQKTITVFE